MPAELWVGGDTHTAWGTGPDWIYRVRYSTGSQLERRRGGQWVVEVEDAVVAVDGVAEGQTVWAVTSERALRLRGGRCAQWVDEPLPGPEVFGAIGRLVAVRVFGPRDVLVLGTELLLRFDGTGWSAVASAPRGWAFASMDGSGTDDLWLVRRKAGRSNEIAIAHSDGLAFTDVDVPGASVFGRLSTSGGETWLATEGQVVRLGATIEALPLPVRIFDATVWASAAQIWLSSATQSLSRMR